MRDTNTSGSLPAPLGNIVLQIWTLILELYVCFTLCHFDFFSSSFLRERKREKNKSSGHYYTCRDAYKQGLLIHLLTFSSEVLLLFYLLMVRTWVAQHIHTPTQSSSKRRTHREVNTKNNNLVSTYLEVLKQSTLTTAWAGNDNVKEEVGTCITIY